MKHSRGEGGTHVHVETSDWCWGSSSTTLLIFWGSFTEPQGHRFCCQPQGSSWLCLLSCCSQLFAFTGFPAHVFIPSQEAFHSLSRLPSSQNSAWEQISKFPLVFEFRLASNYTWFFLNFKINLFSCEYCGYFNQNDRQYLNLSEIIENSNALNLVHIVFQTV